MRIFSGCGGGEVVEHLRDHYRIPVNHRGLKAEYLELHHQAGLLAAVFFTAATRPDQVRELGLDRAAFERITGGNARRLLADLGC